MIPLHDNIPSERIPIVNYSIIAACALVFALQLAQDPEGPSLVERLGMIPKRVVDPDEPVVIRETIPVQTPFGPALSEASRPAAESLVPAFLTLLTCIFLHGGWMHFLGNMWFLHIFGDNVEDRFGRGGYLLFYLGCGVAASLAHLFTEPSSPIPTIGASGAIAGVMGAYFVLYPRAMVVSLVPIFIFFHMVVLPAPFFLGFWFLLQFFQGTLSITAAAHTGVAWWAHIGGFVVGVVVAWLLRRLEKLNPEVEITRPRSDHLGMYRIRRRRPWR